MTVSSHRASPQLRAASIIAAAAIVGGAWPLLGAGRPDVAERGQAQYVVMGYNDLGMHCMNEDFSELCILPPYNTLHATVLRHEDENPDIITSGVTVRYLLPQNTRSVDKTNFWAHDVELFGVDLPPDVGLTGHGLSGVMTPTGHGDWEVTGIPVTPVDDDGREDPYPLATIIVERQGVEVARTQAVVPVSWEISCNLCHGGAGISVATDILMDHDRLHQTNLVDAKPVLCASCHADPALGAPGQPGVSFLSHAMHGAHASRMGPAQMLESECYACHPGVRTACQRDVHLANGMTCAACHDGMKEVGDPARTPWVDEPRCADCHDRPGFEFEEPGLLYRQSRGHRGVQCMACHGSPHAITPTITGVDNLQAIRLQGHAGTIDTCTVCHGQQPGEPFPHRRDDD
jgi:hypothetical protein